MSNTVNHSHKVNAATDDDASRNGNTAETRTGDAMRRLNEDLQIHQIELEQQNEELRRVHDQLEAAHSRYFRLYELAPAGYITLSANGLILEVNLTVAGMLEQDRGTLLKKPLTRFMLKSDQPVFYQCRQQLLDTRQPQARELRMLKADGATFWVRLEASLVKVTDGLPLYYVVLSDITALKQSEARLQETHSLLASTLEATADGILVVSLTGHISAFNQRFLDMWGIPRTLAEKCTDAELVQFIRNQLEESDRFIGGLKAMYASEATLTDDLTFRDGRVFERHSQPQYAHGVHIGRVISFRDISVWKRTQKVMQARLHLLGCAPMDTLDAFIPRTLDKIEHLTNSQISFYHFLEPDQKTLLLQRWSSNTLAKGCKAKGRGDHCDITRAGLWVDCVHSRQAVIYNDYQALPHRRPLVEGHAPLVRLLLVPIFRGPLITAIIGIGNKPADYNANDIEFVSQLGDLAWDIIERKRAEAAQITNNQRAEQERLMRESAETANRAKSTFLANMSHEIRTPLNAIIGFAQILERDASLNPIQARQVDTIARSGKHLLNLINDILDLSRIESGQQSLNNSDFSLHDLLEDLENMFRSRTEAKGLQLLVERHQSVPQFVTSDEGKLRQVLINLLGNAVKFTEHGGVAVRVRADALTAADGNQTAELRLCVEVEDSGPGIAKADQALIFKAFHQSEAGRIIGGTGLGLPICRSLIDMLGGRMGVTSQLDRGACFYFDIPLKPAAGRNREQKQNLRRVIGLAPENPVFRILVVDDNQTNRELLHDLLKPVGFELQEAADGQQALEVFETWAPDAVLMDMRMPVMDGYEATRRLKATSEGQKTPVIAVTASAFIDNEQAVLATGVDSYVRKPFRPEELFAALETALGLHYVYADAAEAPEPRPRAARLTRAYLADLPPALLQTMQEATEEGDMTRLKQVLGQVEDVNRSAAQSLYTLAEQYDYEKLLQLLTPGNTTHE